MDFKENIINFFSSFALLRVPIVWPSRARFGPQAPIEDLWSKVRCYVTLKHWHLR